MRENAFTAIPGVVWRLPALRALSLEGQPARGAVARAGALSGLADLVVAESGLTSVPAALGDLGAAAHARPRPQPPSTRPAVSALQLEVLYLSDNLFGQLPAAIRAIKRLSYLRATDNALATLPAWTGELAALVELRLNANAVTSPPTSLGALRALRELHLRDNRLTALPDELGDLTDLRHLDLRANALESLPATLGHLHRLRALDLRANRLTALPLADLPALDKLDLR